jgi:hypothetical protein
MDEKSVKEQFQKPSGIDATPAPFTWADARAAVEAERAAAREQPQTAAPAPPPSCNPVNEIDEWIREIKEMSKRRREHRRRNCPYCSC